jgi:hypothetical protein
MKEVLAIITLATAASILALLPALNYYEYVDLYHTTLIGVLAFSLAIAAYFASR